MLKVGLLCGVIAAMSATGVKANLQRNNVESKSTDTKFIVELEDDIDNISVDEAIKQQDAMFAKIKRSVNRNVTKEQHFTTLTNSLVISGNKEDKEAIKQIKGVKSVTENGTHVIEKTQGSSISIDLNGGSKAGEIDLSQNASAVTMKKPDDTNDGEGTLIAILDNEFYLRGRQNGEDAFCHKTYSPLDSSVKVRLTSKKMKDLCGDNGTHAQPNGAIAGTEGSLYFNNKVPFYYDYAGDSHTGSARQAEEDYNVYSEIGLHGSHVSSIAGGNDPGYKGIAPKSQLVLMKVFSDVYTTPFTEAAKMGKYSSFSEIGFINALEDCIKLGVDSINVSIGSDLADFDKDSISMKTLSKLAKDSNILTSISAGNGGKSSFAFTGGYGNWTRDMVETGIMGSFANNHDVMTIAAGQPEWTFYEDSFRIGDSVVAYDDQIVNREGEAETYPNCEHKFIELVSGDKEVDPTAEQQEIEIPYIYVKGFGKVADYKNKDCEGKIVIVNRGSINFSEKYTNAANEGARGLIIINNDPTSNDFNFRCDFGGELPDFPIALALFKDKALFEANPEGTLKIKKNTSSENLIKNTVSDYSTDGCTYDLDLKPEITSPGSNIKGAVWPQNKKEKLNPYEAYEYFNGTSMAAPNFEGAMSVVLSKVTKDMLADDKISNAEQAVLEEAKRTMNMRMMSTAIPMHDAEENGENGVKSLTSPRMQGAGMANIGGAYKTDVYLEGTDIDGTKLNKSKILLRNNEDIANGRVKLSFYAHNESASARKYNVKFNVMRPATAESNKVLTADYGKPIEVDSVKNIPGFSYYSPEEEKVVVAEGTASYKDVIKVSKDIMYFQNEAEYLADDPKGVFKEGMYYCSSKISNSSQGIVWDEVPTLTYQSVKDIEIASVDAGSVEIPANSEKFIELNSYELTKEQKDKIQELYAEGTYIEGFVTLTSVDEESYPSLGMPYLGFYSLTDRKAGNSFSSAPVVEPFSFEKDPTKIYGSDLVNDLTKQLIGKDRTDFGSMMLTGYAKTIDDINIDRILVNDESFKDVEGFYEVGTKPDPYKNELFENPGDNIYLGSPEKSNTLVIQQFVMRSVSHNYFTIINKANGQEVYRSSLTDMLFGEQDGAYPLYKSHVDADYLGAGYVAHRAYAIVPMYNPTTKEAFASGEYEIKFNYQLAATSEWVSKAYTLHVDSENPLVDSISSFNKDGKDIVRVEYKDAHIAYAVFGSNKVEVKYDEAKKVYYSEVEKSLVDSCVSSSQKTSYSDSRLYITVVDYARGETTAIVHFGKDYNSFEIAQSSEFSHSTDFKIENGTAKFIELDKDSEEHELIVNSDVVLVTGESKSKAKKKGCFGSLIESSAIISTVALTGAGLIFLKKRKQKEEK